MPDYIAVWDELNERQQTYLREIYRLDQINERDQRHRSAEYYDNTPASVWRKVWYDNDPNQAAFGTTPLFSTLKGAGYVDSGTGATFAALETRKLIERHYGRYIDGTSALAVILTRRGRAVMRAVTGDNAHRRLPTGVLKKKQWEALAATYHAGEDGLPKTGAAKYGGFSWQWHILRLRDYKDGPLIREKSTRTKVQHPNAFPTIRTDYAIVATERGRTFYEQHYADYKERYPDANALPPGEDMTDKAEKFSRAVKSGMQQAASQGKHIGRPSDSPGDILNKYPLVIQALRDGLSLRKAASAANVSVNTVRKVKAALDDTD